MAIIRVGSNSANATSVAIPAHVQGDLILISAAMTTSAGTITVPAGSWSSHNVLGSAAGIGCSMSIYWQIADKAGIVSGTWTGAESLTVTVYRGARAVNQLTFNGDNTLGSLTNVEWGEGAAALAESTSWVVDVAVHRADTTLTSPAGLTNVALASPSGGGAHVIHDTESTVTSWPASLQTTVVSGNWMEATMELLAGSATQKFYLHDAVTPNSGTMPSGQLLTSDGTSAASQGDAVGAQTVRDATGVIGTANPDTESTITSLANVSTQGWGHRRYVSRPLRATTFTPSDGLWTFSYARSESNLNHNGAINLCVWIWRPSASARVGTFSVGMLGQPPSVASTEQAEAITNGPVGSQSILDGDILVFEITSTFVQSMSTAYTDNFAYDGTTEASVTTCATFVQLPFPVSFTATPSSIGLPPALVFEAIPFIGNRTSL